MSRIYLPYIIGSSRPIPYLFKKIIPYLSNPKSTIVTFTNMRGGILNERHVTEVFIGDNTSIGGAIRFRIKYPIVSLGNFDLLHTGGRPPSHKRMAWLARRRNPDIAHLHTLRIDVDPDLPTHKERETLVREADTVTAVSEHTANTAERTWGIEPRVIYNGVDTNLFKPDYPPPKIFDAINEKRPVFLYVGSLERRKRPQDVIEVAKSVTEVTFIIIGDGPLMDEIKRREGNLKNIRITGRLSKSELPPIYANADGLIFPSLKEGCPNVVLEGMASGLPIVGYEATSVPELVNHRRTGYLADPCEIDGLINGVKTVLNRSSEMGEYAREYVKRNHSFDHIGKEYRKAYDELL